MPSLRQESRAHRVPKALRDRLVQQERLVLWGRRVPRETQETLAPKESKESKGLQALMALMELTERRVYKAFREHLEQTVLMEPRDLRARRETREILAHKDLLE